MISYITYITLFVTKNVYFTHKICVFFLFVLLHASNNTTSPNIGGTDARAVPPTSHFLGAVLPSPPYVSAHVSISVIILLPQVLSGRLVPYLVSSWPLQYSPKSAHLRHQHPPFVFFSQFLSFHNLFSAQEIQVFFTPSRVRPRQFGALGSNLKRRPMHRPKDLNKPN